MDHSSANRNTDPELSAAQLRARVMIVGSAGPVEQLTYCVPPALAERLTAGSRVLVPLRSRRVTAIVLEVGEKLDAGGVAPRAVLELLDARPLFDRPHLELINFMATYYMAPLAEAYRSVMPATARVESHRRFHVAAEPSPLAAATFSALERAILAALAKRGMTARQLRRLGQEESVEAALNRLLADGYAEPRNGARGRHRDTQHQSVRLVGDAGGVLRGVKQRAIVERLAAAGAAGLPLEELAGAIVNARLVLRGLIARGVAELVPSDAHGVRDTVAAAAPSPYEATWEQTAVITEIVPAIRERRFETFLLWGITGSGKTEVYVRLAAEALAAGRQVIVLVPEIALADQVVQAFRQRFGALAAVLHSAQNVVERWAGWMAALSGATRVIIGPRSAIFAPLHDAGLIVVDEEHDPAYKQEEGIRYHARDLAVKLGRLSGCPVVLGSATPSAESYANARRGRYKMTRLTARVSGRELAAVELLDLRQNPPAPDARNGADLESAEAPPVPLSPVLIDALRGNLAAGGQSIVFLNRRGYHNFLQCHLCGNVIACANCSVSMTFHLRDRTVRCHYCGAHAPAPEKCPACDGLGLEGQGFGTERLTQAIADLLPAARIERLDSDTSGRSGARGAIVEALRRGAIDVVVGTQMITKGFDFPGVTLVGVVLADLTLNLPDFRSAERTFQLLTQVAGRAGRGDKPGRVLIQTYAPHHYSVRAARDQDYARFMRRELDLRNELGYPPFGRMALVRIEGPAAAAVSAIASRVAALLGRAVAPDSMRILGPAPAPIERIKQRFRWQVVVKSPRLDQLRRALAAMRTEVDAAAERAGVRVAIDLDPVNMM
ncbi:MAG TPA: primosomal protein N' [Candidatus Binataceae bacterium]|nr:primosomal protein N' [Candidatus Binataceae bacterium]